MVRQKADLVFLIGLSQRKAIQQPLVSQPREPIDVAALGSANR